MKVRLPGRRHLQRILDSQMRFRSPLNNRLFDVRRGVTVPEISRKSIHHTDRQMTDSQGSHKPGRLHCRPLGRGRTGDDCHSSHVPSSYGPVSSYGRAADAASIGAACTNAVVMETVATETDVFSN